MTFRGVALGSASTVASSFLVAMPGAPSSVLVPSRGALWS